MSVQHHNNTLARVKDMPIASLIERYVPLKRAGQRMTGLCPFHSEKTPSFFVDVKRNTFRCYGCGENGDAVGFLQKLERMEFKDALAAAASVFGIGTADYKPRRVVQSPVAKAEDEKARIAREIAQARAIWDKALDANGTIVARYLGETRCIPLDKLPQGRIPPCIKFVPDLSYYHFFTRKSRVIGRYPAMVAAIQDKHGVFIGVHMTYLDPVTLDKVRLADPENPDKLLPAKKIRGQAWGGAIRLAKRAAHMGTSEGIENGLTVIATTGLPVWAAISLGNLAGAGIGSGEPHPVKYGRALPTVYPDPERPGFEFPPSVQACTVLGEKDSKDQHGADCMFERAVRKFNRSLKYVRMMWPPMGCDFNDVLRGRHVG